ncbi:TetR/AcrR family transcriptional regulator [Pontivivens ytuae]|uniref:TetR/AcrR family transcriptional regulator n=1 Tax=Pontivivens ytuae TaxID=2789856 RepID=A0A7S9LTP5_9RHOB|nr:TetR/AcrR family transcriptional regulator [Pontivivens ytuae]QPH54956.1 TetR/AcrR family transcriptional regulator [Pontivivens ytuae]
MPRKKVFDEGEVLDAAMRVFWTEGWHGATVPALRAATGLSSSSLYNAFGDKAGLYHEAMDRYGAVFGARLRESLEDPDIRIALTGFFDRFLDQLEDPQIPPGCMTAQACFDLGGNDAPQVDDARAALERPRAALEARIAKAVEDGALRKGTDAAALADLYVVLLRGAAATHRATGDTRWARNAFRQVMDQLPIP